MHASRSCTCAISYERHGPSTSTPPLQLSDKIRSRVSPGLSLAPSCAQMHVVWYKARHWRSRAHRHGETVVHTQTHPTAGLAPAPTMVALLPVALALGLACSRRDLARHGSAAPDASGPGSTSASPVKARDANISGVSPGEGSAFDWFVRGGGKYGNSLATAEGAGAQSVSLFGPEEKVKIRSLNPTNKPRFDRDEDVYTPNTIRKRW